MVKRWGVTSRDADACSLRLGGLISFRARVWLPRDGLALGFAGGSFGLGLLKDAAGELVLALVALSAKTGTATRAAPRRGGGGFVGQLQEHEARGVADTVVRELDDAGVTALPV